jgi:hypothetical protein
MGSTRNVLEISLVALARMFELRVDDTSAIPSKSEPIPLTESGTLYRIISGFRHVARTSDN